MFPGETFLSPRGWAEQVYLKLILWNEVERGGHFAAFEEPMLFVNESPSESASSTPRWRPRPRRVSPRSPELAGETQDGKASL